MLLYIQICKSPAAIDTGKESHCYQSCSHKQNIVVGMIVCLRLKMKQKEARDHCIEVGEDEIYQRENIREGRAKQQKERK